MIKVGYGMNNLPQVSVKNITINQFEKGEQ